MTPRQMGYKSWEARKKKYGARGAHEMLEKAAEKGRKVLKEKYYDPQKSPRPLSSSGGVDSKESGKGGSESV